MITIFRTNRACDMSPEDLDELSHDVRHSSTLPRLTRDEVIALAQAKDAGKDEAGNYTETGLAARNALVEHNLQLVSRIARAWVSCGVPLADLKQEGTIGLMRAADLFDWRVGTEFSTYAAPRILQACQRAIENMGHTIRVPVHVRTSGRCAPEAERAKNVLSGDKRLPSRLSNDGPPRFLFDFVADKNTNTESEAIDPLCADETRRAIAGALDMLNPQERQMIELRYLSGSDEPVPMRVVGEQMGISKQRIEQVKRTAFEKLRAALEVEHAS